ncbi:hypothetical protein TYRP_023238, partial [Tyrophagus putrescentiae]
MDLAFDVMRHLLARQIDRLMGLKRSAHLLMVRRTNEGQSSTSGISGGGSDSVAEAMLLNWLSVCLFKYSKEVVSGPLYLLNSAIKHQIEKGPVDAVTGVSRYSLSEEQLLQEQVEYRSLTVYVSVDDRLQAVMPPPLAPPPPSPPNHHLTSAAATLSRNRSTIGCRSAMGGNMAINNITTTTTRRPSTLMSTSNTLNRGGGGGGGGGGRTVEDEEYDHCDRKAMISDGGGDNHNAGSDSLGGVQGGGGGGSGGSSGNSSASPSTGTTSATSTSTGNSSTNNGSNNNGSNSSSYLCRLLDCDTISQAKGKILDTLYRSVGVSQRPDPEEVTLLWRCLKAKSTASTFVNSNSAEQQQLNSSSSREVGVIENHTSPYQQQILSSTGVINSTNTISNSHPPSSSHYTIQDIYGVASMMSKADADKIYNASRRSDTASLLLLGSSNCEVTELPLEDHDASTQMLMTSMVASDEAGAGAAWRRLNTLSHYGVGDGAQLVLCLKVPSRIIPKPWTKGLLQLGLTVQPLQCNLLFIKWSSSGGSLSTQQQQQQQNNGGHLLSNYYHLGAQNDGSTLNRSTIYGPGSVSYDVIGNGSGHQIPLNSTILGPEEIYGGSSGHGYGGPRPYGPNIYSPALMSTPATIQSPALNYSRTALLTRNQSDAEQQPRPADRLFKSSNIITLTKWRRGGRRSLARNFYDRLSSLVRSSSSSTRGGFGHTASTGFKFGSGNGSMAFNGGGGVFDKHKTAFGDTGEEDEDNELINGNGHHPPPQRLAPGQTEQPDKRPDHRRQRLLPLERTGTRNHSQTMRQRRTAALQRRRQKQLRNNSKAFFGRRTSGGMNGRLMMNASQTQSLTSAASAALSASQMNLHSVSTGSGGHHLSSPPPPPPPLIITPSSLMMVNSPPPSSPLSAFTTSASNFFSSLFGSRDQEPFQEGSTDQLKLSSTLQPKSIPEIYLTRLLSTKGTIQQYVDDLWLFDFLDAASASASAQPGNQQNSSSSTSATILATTSEQQTTLVWSDALGRQWKSNTLVGRFWVDLLRKPELLFDLRSSAPVNVCLEVLAANLAEAAGCAQRTAVQPKRGETPACHHHNNSSFSLQLFRCTQEGRWEFFGGGASADHQQQNCSPSKLLFARDIAAYRALIGQYYADVAQLPPVNEAELLAYMKEVSKNYEGKVCKERSVSELISYCLLYKEVIFAALSADPATQREHLHLKFESLIYAAAAAAAACAVDHPQNLQNQALFHNSLASTLSRQPATFYPHHQSQPPISAAAAFSLSGNHDSGISR